MIKISVIMPTLNRATFVKDAVKSICKSKKITINQYEVIVVDNGSTDNTKDVCISLIEQFPEHNIVYVYEPIAGLLSGRHKGVEYAKGDILTFVDDDIIVDPLWLYSIDESFEKLSGCEMLGGRSLPKYESEPPSWLNNLWYKKDDMLMCGYLSLIDLGLKTKQINPRYIWGLNYSIKKETFLKLGGFNPDCMPTKLQRFQGDGETGLSLKAIDQNVKAYYNPNVLVYHLVPRTRMTKEYMYKRMFYQGVCDSYTKLRKYKKFSDIKERESRKIVLKQDISIEEQVKIMMHNGYLDGYIFHQKEVFNDKKLFEWVIKEDYFDYDYTKYMDGL